MVSTHIQFCELAVGKLDVCESPLFANLHVHIL